MTSRIMIGCAAVALLIGLAVACDEKKPDATPDAAPATGSATTASTAPGGAEETEEDFEEEAAASITPETLETELAKLEAEIK